MCDPIGSAIENWPWAAIQRHIGRFCRADTGEALLSLPVARIGETLGDIDANVPRFELAARSMVASEIT